MSPNGLDGIFSQTFLSLWCLRLQQNGGDLRVRQLSPPSFCVDRAAEVDDEATAHDFLTQSMQVTERIVKRFCALTGRTEPSLEFIEDCLAVRSRHAFEVTTRQRPLIVAVER